MAKNLLGVDIGSRYLKMALVNGKKVLKTAIVELPTQMISEGRIVSPETMAEIIHDTMKANGMKAKEAALCIYGECVSARNITMPVMSIEQLEYNLPYEFRDYINDDLRDYVFDYAMITTAEELVGSPKKSKGENEEGAEDDSSLQGHDTERRSMELLGVAVSRELLSERAEMFKKAGLKLVKVAPDICGNASLIRIMDPEGVRSRREYCILDLGYKSIGMDMYKGDCHVVSRVLDHGLSEVETVIADVFNIDLNLAHTYLMTNHEECQYHQRCLNLYDTIAVELMRAVNFYTFNHMDSRLEDIWICGGGAAIPPFMDAIKNNLMLNIHSVDELIPGGSQIEDACMFVQALGVVLDRD